MKIVDCKQPPSDGERRNRIRMKKPADAIRLLNRVVNDLIGGDIETDKARAIIYALSTLPKLYEVAELENRILQLEERLPK